MRHIDLWGLQKAKAPSVTGVLFESFQNARAGLFNIEARIVGSDYRMRVNYDEDGFISIKNPVIIQKESKKSNLAEAGDFLWDMVSLSPLGELNAIKGELRAPFLAAKTTGIASVFNFRRLEALSKASQVKVDELVAIFKQNQKWGDIVPPIEVVKGRSGNLYILDGHHRYAAAKKAGIEVKYSIVPEEDLFKYGYKDLREVMFLSYEVGKDKIK